MSYYIENIFLCLAVPLILSMLFRKGKQRTFTTFVILGMGCCLLSAYVSSFFAGNYSCVRGSDEVSSAFVLSAGI